VFFGLGRALPLMVVEQEEMFRKELQKQHKTDKAE
jgi:hypothetical protein